MQEGICKNCGSIVFVDPREENCHCVFCHCVFPSAEALEIAKNPNAYEFPNEEQPEYIPPETQRNQVNIKKSLEKLEREQNQQKAAKARKKPQYAVEQKKLPNINLTKKQIFTTIGIFVLIFGLFIAIMLPRTIRRDEQREEITKSFKANIELGNLNDSLDFEEGFVISRLDNSHLDLITGEKLSKEQARAIFEEFCKVRAEVLGKELDDDLYRQTSLRIAVPDKGGYLIENRSLADLKDPAAISELP